MTKNNEYVGAWIKINLDGVYRLSQMMVLDHTDDHYTGQNISLSFSNGEQVGFTLDDVMGTSWQTIDLVGIGNDIITNYVKISFISFYYHRYPSVAFRELKVFRNTSGMILTITE